MGKRCYNCNLLTKFLEEDYYVRVNDEKTICLRCKVGEKARKRRRLLVAWQKHKYYELKDPKKKGVRKGMSVVNSEEYYLRWKTITEAKWDHERHDGLIARALCRNQGMKEARAIRDALIGKKKRRKRMKRKNDEERG